MTWPTTGAPSKAESASGQGTPHGSCRHPDDDRHGIPMRTVTDRLRERKARRSRPDGGDRSPGTGGRKRAKRSGCRTERADLPDCGEFRSTSTFPGVLDVLMAFRSRQCRISVGTKGLGRVLVARAARPEPGRRARVHDDQSLRGVLHRINPGQPGEALLLSAAVVLPAPDHRMWCVPAFLALGLVSWSGTRVALAGLPVVFCVQPFAWLPHTGDREVHWAWWQHIPGDAYVGVGVATLVVLTSTTWRRIRSRV